MNKHWGFWIGQWRFEGRGLRILLIGKSGTICRRFGGIGDE